MALGLARADWIFVGAICWNEFLLTTAIQIQQMQPRKSSLPRSFYIGQSVAKRTIMFSTRSIIIITAAAAILHFFTRRRRRRRSPCPIFALSGRPPMIRCGFSKLDVNRRRTALAWVH